MTTPEQIKEDIREVLGRISKATGIKAADIVRGTSRQLGHVQARQTAFHLLSQKGHGATVIAEAFGLSRNGVASSIMRYQTEGRHADDELEGVAKSTAILDAVHKATGVPPQVVRGTCRTLEASYARFLAMKLYAETRPWSSNLDAALSVGKRDPGTGRHGLMRAEYLLANDAEFRQAHARARAELGLETATAH